MFVKDCHRVTGPFKRSKSSILGLEQVLPDWLIKRADHYLGYKESGCQQGVVVADSLGEKTVGTCWGKKGARKKALGGGAQ